MIDATDGRPEIKVASSAEFDLAAYWRGKGYTVVETESGPGYRGPFAVANCTGVVKAALGLRAPFAWTPFQLFKHLRKR